MALMLVDGRSWEPEPRRARRRERPQLGWLGWLAAAVALLAFGATLGGLGGYLVMLAGLTVGAWRIDRWLAGLPVVGGMREHHQ